MVALAGQADVVCSFVNMPNPTWGTDAVGDTVSEYNPATYLITPGSVSVTCAIHTSQGQLLSSAQMQTTIAHELGHALGINGHSPYPSDLMYAVQQPGISTPQTRDLNTAMSAYLGYFSTAAPTQAGQYRTASPSTPVRVEIQ